MPFLKHDLCHYYKDQLVIEPDHVEMSLSKDDKKVVFSEENVEEVVGDTGQKKLQFPLPWKERFPVTESYQLLFVNWQTTKSA